MLKIVFYYQNLNKVKDLCNSVINLFENLQVVGIATNEQELNSLLKNTNAHIVIYNYEDINNERILNLLEEFNSKIIFHTSLKHIRNSKHTLYINSNNDYSNIQKQLSNFIYKIDEPIIYKKAVEILKKLNFNFKLKGTFFLLNCITYSYFHKEKYVSDNLEKNVYPKIAKQFNVTLASVKWSIIRAINDVNFYSNNNNLRAEKITAKSLINEVLYELN